MRIHSTEESVQASTIPELTPVHRSFVDRSTALRARRHIGDITELVQGKQRQAVLYQCVTTFRRERRAENDPVHRECTAVHLVCRRAQRQTAPWDARQIRSLPLPGVLNFGSFHCLCLDAQVHLRTSQHIVMKQFADLFSEFQDLGTPVAMCFLPWSRADLPGIRSTARSASNHPGTPYWNPSTEYIRSAVP